MISGGLTETIWHFAGHFHIIHDIARDRVDYDASLYRNQPEEYETPRPEYAYNVDVDDLNGQAIPLPSLTLFDDLHAGRAHPLKLLSTPDADPDSDQVVGSPLAPLRSAAAGGGGGGGIDRVISVSYEPGGEQTQLEIHQYNLGTDNDVMLQGGGVAPVLDGEIAQLTIHSAATLQSMADAANMVIPAEWWMPHSGQGVVEFLRAHDVANDGTPSPYSVEPGYYLNGEIQEPAPEPPLPTLELYEKPDFGSGVGQWAETGANTSFNAALIVDLTESGQTMIVMGDYFSTNAIFQTNSLVDHDKVVSNGSVLPAVSSGENTTDNAADFIQHPGLYSAVPAHFGGWEWHVNVVNGDYYSIHAVTQTNLLLDNDVVVQTGSQAHYEAVSGGNGQVNLAEVFDGDIHYDLIIVAGAYHGMNVIFQNNILLDNDQIWQQIEHAASPGGASSDGNQLLNAATIETFGGDKFEPMNADLDAIVASIAGGAASLDPALGKILAGPDGVINVLYVTGEYYDVNAVWQTNVTSDIDVIMQLIEPTTNVASVDRDAPATQSLSAGANKLTNEAVIVDVGATHTFVNGDVYADTILVQANLLPTDVDPAVNGDTNTLVTELIAFVDENQKEEPVVQPAIGPPHDDAVANVMH